MKNDKIGAGTTKLADLQIDLLSKIRNEIIGLDDLEWFLNLSQEERNKFFPDPDKRFKISKEFKIKIPKNYKHETQLATFSKKYKKQFYYFNEDITDENFSKVTDKLVAGKTYTVKIISILQKVSSEDCIRVLKKNNAIFGGAQVASITYQLKKNELPKGKFYLSFDEKNSLWEDADGNHRVPRLYHYDDGVFSFRLRYFERDWYGGSCLLAVCPCD